ncbi:MAG: tyrosine--tRNA ligase [Myxococcota bacterium]|jgi:tyrosyl-tRNA synthetase|nr:tyrosine--tRNA ligase [Myxococcota bacterium]
MAQGSESFLAELEWRGLLHQTAGQGLGDHLGAGPRTAYTGFDPSADSLGVGNLVPLSIMRMWQRAGHKPILLVGGATGMIGDPGGKDAERNLLSEEEVRHNVECQTNSIRSLFTWEDEDPKGGARLVNNVDWWRDLSFMNVLRDIGKHFSVNAMIQRDSVKDRLENRDQGISFTEFSYMLLQAYDFLHLYKTADCTVQIAGSDQYGNCVSGMDLIRRDAATHGTDADSFVVTTPLLLKADGKKFGKSESGNVWLSPERTSPYAFYQFWINASDDDVSRFLRTFTLFPREEIESIEQEHAAAPHQRAAQQQLAEYVTASVHGADELARVQAASGALFGKGDLRELDAKMLGDVFADVPSSTHAKTELEKDGVSLADLLPETTLAKSKREAREYLKNGAISINGQKATPETRLVTSDLLHGKTILIKRGKKLWHATQWPQ